MHAKGKSKAQERFDALIDALRMQAEIHRKLQQTHRADADNNKESAVWRSRSAGVAAAYGWTADQLEALTAKATGQERA